VAGVEHAERAADGQELLLEAADSRPALIAIKHIDF
jgi:hypothetical protein